MRHLHSSVRQVWSRLNWSRNYAAKEIHFGVDARVQMLKGMEELADAMKVTMGPKITIDLFACNMDRNVWDKPNVWDPERFLSSKSDMRDLNKTMDFGGVRRVYAGSSLAMLISTTTMGRFVQEFNWRL